MKSIVAPLLALVVASCVAAQTKIIDETKPLEPKEVQPMKASVGREKYGMIGDEPVYIWTLVNANGMKMKVTNYGTIITELWVPDASGKLVDIVLGRDSLQGYIDRTQYFGCTAGRCANRIAKGQFSIDGKPFQVTCNNGVNSLHGGAKGFDKVVWKGGSSMVDETPTVTFTYVSKDGEEGFPGACTARVRYTLTRQNELKVSMEAKTVAPTVVNLAHHSYWNLGGQESGSILDHELSIDALEYTPVDSSLITTGEIKSVEGTPLDFRSAKAIGRDIGQFPATKDDPGGFDHNFVVRDFKAGQMHRAAVVRSPKTGIQMTISSDQPGIQFYSGNFLDGIPGKSGAVYNKNGALCLETQAFPDSINKQGKPGWPNVILRPGETYKHEMVHAFTTTPN